MINKFIQEDILYLLHNIFSNSNISNLHITVSKFLDIFKHNYSLKYQKDEVFAVDIRLILHNIRELSVCPKIKCNKRNVKWLKFSKIKVEERINERRLRI